MALRGKKNPAMKRINILGIDKGAGKHRDMRILAAVLSQAGHEVHMTCLPDALTLGLPHRISRHIGARLITWLYRLPKPARTILNRPEYDINLFIETILPGWFPRASQLFDPQPGMAAPAPVALSKRPGPGAVQDPACPRIMGDSFTWRVPVCPRAPGQWRKSGNHTRSGRH
jgi:hypothetical protein